MKTRLTKIGMSGWWARGWALALVWSWVLAGGVRAQSFGDALNALANRAEEARRRAQEAQRGAEEVVRVLKADGVSYTQFTSVVVSRGLRVWVDKGTKPSDYLYFYPQNPEIQSMNAKYDAFILPSGYSEIVEGKMGGKYLTKNPDGTFTYRSWDGEYDEVEGVRTSGSYLSSGYSRWNLAWIIPENVEIVKYDASVRGRWSFKAPVLSFYASDVNHIWYSVTFRVRQSVITSMETLP